jgi:hypothetical protein
MAKISARGATKIAEYRSSSGVLVVCSDGRVLRRYVGAYPTGYSVIRRNVDIPKLIEKMDANANLTRTV